VQNSFDHCVCNLCFRHSSEKLIEPFYRDHHFDFHGASFQEFIDLIYRSFSESGSFQMICWVLMLYQSVASAVVLPVISTSFLSGVNMAGYDFGINTDGSATGTPVTPPTSQFAHFAGQGVNVFRVPFGWQYMQPTLGGAIDSSFFSRYDATVKLALSQSTKPYVILDLHNYARWNGAVVGQGGPTNDQYVLSRYLVKCEHC
jgi:hypothetical protein